jgi:hypothetical protein
VGGRGGAIPCRSRLRLLYAPLKRFARISARYALFEGFAFSTLRAFKALACQHFSFLFSEAQALPTSCRDH